MARKHRDVMRIRIADIVSGARPAADTLPPEVDLAAAINEPDDWEVFDPDVLAATLASERGSEVLAEYLECRRILEVEAAGLAAERATKRDVEQLTAALRR